MIPEVEKVEDRRNPIDHLNLYLIQISKHDAESILSPDSFRIKVAEAGEVTAVLKSTIGLATEMLSLPFALLPIDTVGVIRDFAQALLQRIERIDQTARETVVASERPEREEGLLNVIRNDCHSLSNALISVYPYLVLKSPAKEAHAQEVGLMLEKLHEGIDSQLSDARAKQIELDAIMVAARDAAAQAGIAHHAQTFKAIAADHREQSKGWLLAAATLAGLAVVGAIVALTLFPPLSDLSDPSTIQRIVAKVLIIVGFYSAAIWAARNYRTHRHLEVQNAHRQSALETFDAFVKGASGDEQTKNAVLLEATRCIFAPANTGYLGGDEDPSSNRIIEIVKTVTGGATNK